MDGDRKDDDQDGGAQPEPRRTYMPKPPSKEEVDQVSREQEMIADEWTGEPSPGDAAENEPPPLGRDVGG